jgi:hypothetical protein
VVGGQRHSPAALSPGKTQHQLYRRLGVPQGRFGGVQKISRQQGFDPRTIEPVASCYTDWAIPVHVVLNNHALFKLSCSSDVVTHEELGMRKLVFDKSFILKQLKM